MTEIDRGVDRAAFELLGQIVDRVGVAAIGQVFEVARNEWADGRPGPMIVSPPNAVPPYSMALGERQVDFRYGEWTGSLPTDALLQLAGVNQPAAAA